MNRKLGRRFVAASFVVLIALLFTFLARFAMHRSPEVTLPQPIGDESVGSLASSDAREAIHRVEVTPETVQRVIERLYRPSNYHRSLVIERYWSDGSGKSTVETSVAGSWTRLDMTNGSTTRHTVIYNGLKSDSIEPHSAGSWIWYNDEKDFYRGAASLTADEEQSILTYEDVLLLDKSSILTADYRTLDGINCIYVETLPDSSGYLSRYWISVDNGLLVAAERAQGDFLTYNMRGLTVELGTVSASAFTLPNGEILYDPYTGSEP